MKVIHLWPYSTPHIEYVKEKESPFYNRKEDTSLYGGWPRRIAEHVLKQTKRYEIEYIRSEKRMKKPFVDKKNGITYKIFPSFNFKGFEFPISLIKEIKELQKKEQILLHLYGITLFNLFTASRFKDVPSVVQDLGGSPSILSIKNKYIVRLVQRIKNEASKSALKNIDHFFVRNEEDKRHLSSVVDPNSIEIQIMGADFDKFKPMDKKKAKRLLGINEGKKVLLYVGDLSKYPKRVDLILESFEIIRKRCDVELILAGAGKKDPLYDRASKMEGVRIIGWLPHDKLLPVYNAADVYILPVFWPGVSKTTIGLGVALTEALACGVPAVSTTLVDFPKEDVSLVGEIPKNEGDVPNCILKILKNPNKYKRCREIAKKYYDWQKITKNTIRVYDELFDKYYGQTSARG
jgi:glycosyltransferase involved in cell wall biosynthesis